MFETDAGPVPGDWIVRKIQALLRDLREADRNFDRARPWQFLEPLSVYRLFQSGDFDEAIAAVCAKYALDPSRVHHEFVDFLPHASGAAAVHAEPWGEIGIRILRRFRDDPVGLGVVFAHEFGHAYLTDLGIPNGGSWENEATTDLVTMVKGLGKLTVNGVWNMALGERAGTGCFGYLNREGNVFAYVRTAQELGVPPDAMKAGLNPAALSYIRTLTGEPDFLGRLLGRAKALFRKPKKISDLDLAVDEEGNIVER